jgi:hypothetical protein
MRALKRYGRPRSIAFRGENLEHLAFVINGAPEVVRDIFKQNRSAALAEWRQLAA